MIENLENEIWAVHPLYKDYAGSNFGRVKSLDRTVLKSNNIVEHLKEKLIKPQPIDNGYLRFSMSN